MLRCALWVGLLAVLTAFPFHALHADGHKADDKKADGQKADDKKAWQQAEREKLAGRWTASREERTDKDQIRRTRVDLEFTDGRLEVFHYDEKGSQIWYGGLKVIGVEQVGSGPGAASRLNLDKGEVYYDFVGDKLILVGRIGPRPWEGFHLSGEFKRGSKPK